MARGGIRVEVSGVAQVISTLTRFGEKASDLKAAFGRIANKVKSDAIPLTPHSSGALARSIRAGKASGRATVRAGGASRRSHGGGVYAPIAHYGKYTHRQKGERKFLTTAAYKNQDYAVRELSNEIQSIINRMGIGGKELI